MVLGSEIYENTMYYINKLSHDKLWFFLNYLLIWKKQKTYSIVPKLTPLIEPILLRQEAVLIIDWEFIIF